MYLKAIWQMSKNTIMFQLGLTLPVLLLLAMPAAAQELLAPNPSFAPRRVVEIQIQSLQQNDVPSPDFGIAQTWAFAHPDNKRFTGPLARFAAMIKGPSYRMMLGHREHTIRLVVQTDDYTLFAVSIITAAEQRASFRWEVSKVRSGVLSGSWMTTAVSPPLRAKDAI